MADSTDHYKLQMSKAMRQHIAVRLEDQAKAAISASSSYLKIPSADPKHPYLSCKCIRPFFARQQGNLLVLPIRDFSGKLWSLQFINSNGKKWFLPNGAISGNFVPIQLNPIQQGTKILLCEGFATGATLASACPDACVIATCNAGNLKSVAINIRQQLPNVTIVICADDDRLSLKNIGVIKGQEAAIAVGGYFIKPNWPDGSPNICVENALSPLIKKSEIGTTLMPSAQILQEILRIIVPIDFRQLADIPDKEKIKHHHYLVIVIEQILHLAKVNNWGLCRNYDFIYLFNGEYWHLIDEEDLKTFLCHAAQRMGINMYFKRWSLIFKSDAIWLALF